ncbi:MAG: FecR domain-containing protein [Anaerolineae bacterium]|nr:FecR domain-containing protein [Anaerolineae bacterium]
MNEHESEARVQERLELWEKGEPLVVCLQGLDAEEAALVQTAVQLQQTPIPVPDGTAVVAQRAAVMAAGPLAGPASAAIPANHLWKERLISLWQSLFTHREVALALSFVLILILSFAWFGLRGNEPEAPVTAVLPAADEAPVAVPAISPTTAQTDLAALPGTQPEVADEGAAVVEETAVVAESNVPVAVQTAVTGHQLFMPVLSTSLLAGPGQAALHELSGMVEVKTMDGEWTAVTANTHLAAGAHIRTGSLSSAALTFYDGSQAHLGPNAELSLDEVHALQPAEGFRTVVMTQWAGVSDHTVQIRNDGGSRYEVKTPTGSGLARGTQFRVHVQPDGRASYTVTEGKVDVHNQGRTVSLIAGQTTQFAADEPPATPSFLVTGVGLLTQMGDTWIVAGQSFTVNGDTLILGDPQMGDWVSVTGHLVPGSDPVADTIQRLHSDGGNEFTLIGPVESISETVWVVAGQTISVTADTAVDEGINIGDTVRVRGDILPGDGTLVAATIQLLAVPNELPFEFVGVVQAQSDAAWTISGIAIQIDADTQIEEGIGVGDTVKVEGIILPDNTWLAREITLVAPDNATFTITGELFSMSPWNVAGVPFTVAEWTQIEPGLQIGDLVRVTGIILPDGTWVAAEIVRLDNHVLQIIFVGTVDSIDPWVVNGLPLVTDDDTIIEDGIVVGDLVRVVAWIRTDGTWLATQIDLLDDGDEQGCVAITAVITAINGNQVILANGQTILLDAGIIIDGELTVGSVVVIVACVQADGTIVIVSITIIYTPPPPAPPPPGPPPGPGGNVTICHKPGTPAEKTMTLPQSALGGHLGHGDTMGPCP